MSQPSPTPAQISASVRAAYDREPFPAGPPDPKNSHFPNLRWMLAAARPGEPITSIRRILVAGCGSGLEAFVLAQGLPEAQVEGVDFSPRSIEVAEKHKADLGLKNVNFRVADLTSPDLLKMFEGEPFDLITCHGVLSTVVETQAVIDHLAALLGPKGFLYLGFDDSAHVSVVGRPYIESLGYDPEKFEDTPQLRQHLALFDRMHGAALSMAPAGLLANDLFGSIIKVFSAAEMLTHIRAARLKLRTGSLFQTTVLALAGSDLTEWHGWDTDRLSEVVYRAHRLDGFTRLILLKDDLPRPPFDDLKALLNWRPLADTVKFAGVSGNANPAFDETLTVKANTTRMHPDVEFQLSFYIFEFGRKATGEASVAEILASIPHPPPDMGDLVSTLFLFYHGSVLNLLPPKTSWVTVA